MFKRFVQRLVGIQTLKIILVNPRMYEDLKRDQFPSLQARIPIFLIMTDLVRDMKVIDTGIPMDWVGDYGPTQGNE